jgi:hypothetical protein
VTTFKADVAGAQFRCGTVMWTPFNTFFVHVQEEAHVIPALLLVAHESTSTDCKAVLSCRTGSRGVPSAW